MGAQLLAESMEFQGAESVGRSTEELEVNQSVAPIFEKSLTRKIFQQV
jgi:hypothetical protein